MSKGLGSVYDKCNISVSESSSLTCQHLKANLFSCFATYRLVHDKLLSCFVDWTISQSIHEMFGNSCTVLLVGMLTYKHSEVCILKTHMHMLTYEVDLLLLKLIKYFSQSIFHMFSI